MHPRSAEQVHSIFQCPLCNSIPIDRQEEFLSDINFSVNRYDKGDVLVHQGARCDKLLIVIKGKVQTEMADETGDFITIETIKAPKPLATGFLFAANNASPVTAVAILIPKENVYFLMQKYPEFMKTYLSYLSNKLTFLTEKLRLISFRTIKAKLAYYLLKESKGEDQFQLQLSRGEMARFFGVSRPALVNVMMQMTKEGLIKVDRRNITILDRAALRRIIS
ncbi:MAG: Crp/Fnr family transcriptional regulator [Bacteroidota bacterium]|nr:Crp/Fnr family transcriptional regulator [Bacteroidota bacterium]